MPSYPAVFYFTAASSTHVSGYPSQPDCPSPSLWSPSPLGHTSPCSFKTLLSPCYCLFSQPGQYTHNQMSLKLSCSVALSAAPQHLPGPPSPLLPMIPGFPQPSPLTSSAPVSASSLFLPCLNPSSKQEEEKRWSSLQHLFRRRAGAASCIPEESSQGKGKLLSAGAWPVCTKPSETFTSRKSLLMCKLQFTNLAKFRQVFKRMERGNFLLQIPFPAHLHSICCEWVI